MGCVVPPDHERVPGCNLREKSQNLTDGLADLRAGKVDAVLWVGGAPTPEIHDAIANEGLAVRLLPLDGYQNAMQEDWDEFYRSRLGTAFVPGPIYQAETTSAKDYPGVDPIATFAVPNGIAVDRNADPALVRFVAESLFRDKADYERELWGGASGADGRHFPGPQAVASSPLYCLVPLHPTAASYYQAMGIQPSCNKK